MLKQYIKYLKDNPKGYWFRAKWFGWGWTPATWQGWIVIAIYAVLMIFIFSGIDQNAHSVSDTLYGVFVPFIILTAILIAICYCTGEKPRWNWGKPKK